MAESEDLTVDKKLSEIFNEGRNLYKSLETTSAPFNSTEFQNDVKKCICLFEDSTRLVSLIGMFSVNEHFDEIATDHLQYLLLPFFLAQLSTKNQRSDRLESLNVAEIYFRDFIKRCEDYELIKRESEIVAVRRSGTEMEDLIQMATNRNAKIEKFRQKKELEEQLNLLKVAMESESVDDEIKRNFYVKLIRNSILETNEELESMKTEKMILEMRKSNGVEELEGPQTSMQNLSLRSNNPHGHHHHTHNHRFEPLKPIIITRNEAQRAVFGMGYPSLPIMTVKDFYDQRVREGIFPDPEKAATMNPVGGARTEDDEERDREEKEALQDVDDEEYLARQRAMDDYKDNVRRGDGNRHNRS